MRFPLLVVALLLACPVTFAQHQHAAAQGKTREAELVGREFERAWKNADTRLTIADL